MDFTFSVLRLAVRRLERRVVLLTQLFLPVVAFLAFAPETTRSIPR